MNNHEIVYEQKERINERKIYKWKKNIQMNEK